ELPVGAVLGIGILAEPDEWTDEYDKAAIARQLAQRRRPMVLTVGRQTDRPDEPAERITRTCWPVDAVQTGMHEADTRYVYLPIDFVAALIGQADEQGRTRSSGVVQITAAAGADPAAVCAAVREAWKRFACERLGWSAERAAFGAVYISAESPNVKSFTHEIRKQRIIIVLILGLIGLVAALLIFVVLFMIVLQKRREIGILRSLGTSRRGIAALFLAFGAGIGILGAAAGLALGIWATRNIRLIETALMKLFGFKIWKSGVYFFSEIPNSVDFAWASVIVLAGIAMAVLGSLLPALRACRIQPVDALRYE
ncbi:MAG: FtsX-like permease family protein, partial [Sedimentisphaerales bacterium]|nr:FtsX-like permease family protein [Sedimentisphaerales bacterium]